MRLCFDIALLTASCAWSVCRCSMSASAIGSQPQSSHSDTPATPIGVDPRYSDCVLKCVSGSLYYTTKASMAGCSPIFKDLVECCGPEPTSSKVEECHKRGSKLQTCTRSDMMEIPMPDPEEEVKASVELLHQPDRFLGSVVPNVTKKGAANMLQLGPIAHKYHIQGKHFYSGFLWVWVPYEKVVLRDYPRLYQVGLRHSTKECVFPSHVIPIIPNQHSICIM
jgi:hypothetical protein